MVEINNFVLEEPTSELNATFSEECDSSINQSLNNP